MSVAAVGISGAVALGGAAVSAYGSYKASQAQGKAMEQSNAMAQADLAFRKEKYAYADSYMQNGANAVSNAEVGQALGYIGQSAQGYSAHGYSAQGYSATIVDLGSLEKGKTYTSENILADFDTFLEGFKEAIGENTKALDDFNRRYGNIMDNVADGIIKVSQERLSASGREQLMIDSDQMRKDITNRLNVANLNRSGINIELQQRMDMDIEKAARKIDVDSYGQAAGLQAQGIQSLNSMFAIGSQIQGRREGLYGMKAQAGLQNEQFNTGQANQTSRFNASQEQQSSQFNAGQSNQMMGMNAQMENSAKAFTASAHDQAAAFTASAHNQAAAFKAQAHNNAYGAAAQMMGNRAQSRLTAANSFYAGVGMPNASGAIQTSNNLAALQGQNAAGYAQAAGNLAGKAWDIYNKE